MNKKNAKILAVDFANGKQHDFKLFKRSKLRDREGNDRPGRHWLSRHQEVNQELAHPAQTLKETPADERTEEREPRDFKQTSTL